MNLQSSVLKFKQEAKSYNATLVVISKTHPVEAIRNVYDCGIHDFGENKVQEILAKKDLLPSDIRWHMVGHLQTNKVKQIVPYVHLIHGVDSLKLLREIDKEGAKINKKIPVLLQIHIAMEDTKFGLSFDEAEALLKTQANSLQFTEIKGLMGMATYTEDQRKVRGEFRNLKTCFDQLKGYRSANVQMSILSMGMSGDYQIALEEGSTMLRIGSAIFGERNYQ